MAGHIFAGRCAVHRPHRAGEKAEAVDDRRDLVCQHPDPRLAAIERLKRGKSLGVALDRVRELQEQGGALSRRRFRPGPKGALGGLDCGVDLLQRGFRKVKERLLRSRVEDALSRLGSGDETLANRAFACRTWDLLGNRT